MVRRLVKLCHKLALRLVERLVQGFVLHPSSELRRHVRSQIFLLTRLGGFRLAQVSRIQPLSRTMFNVSNNYGGLPFDHANVTCRRKNSGTITGGAS